MSVPPPGGARSGVSIVPATSELLERAAKLAARVYTSGAMGRAFADPEMTLRRWNWLTRNPAGGAPAWVALGDGDVVGHVGTLGVDVVIRGRAQRASWARDLLVDPDMRGRGIGSSLIETATQAASTLFLGGLNQTVRRMYLRLGYRDMGAIPLFVKVLRPDDVLAVVMRPRWSRGVARAVAPLIRATLAGPAPRRKTTSIKHLAPDDPGFDDWWSLVESAFGCVMRRTNTTLGWRYRDHPTHRYTVLAAVTAERLRGIAVIRRGTSRGLAAGFIVELLAHPKDVDTAEDLVGAAERLLHEGPSLAFIRSNLLHPSLARALLRRGFVRVPSTFHWMLAQARPAADDLAECHGWYLNSGDSDLDFL